MNTKTFKKAKYTATIDGWEFSATAHGNHITIFPDMPEQLKVDFNTTGRCGGDSGHGGMAALTFLENGGGCGPRVSTESGKYCDIAKTQIICEGDWELDGLTAALLLLGKILEQQGVCQMTSFSMTDAVDQDRHDRYKNATLPEWSQQSGGAS